MKNGYHGKILHVDLTDERQWIETLDDQIYRTYLGGSALSSYFLLRDLKPGIDPLGPKAQRPVPDPNRTFASRPGGGVLQLRLGNLSGLCGGCRRPPHFESGRIGAPADGSD